MAVTFFLPFSGEWLTFWGGDTAEQNHHHDVQSQKYAFDFIVIGENGNFYKTNGKTNSDYFSFGLDVLAPADGEIVEVVNGLRDNKPKDLNNFNFSGNYIMIKHGERLFSILAHLKLNSMTVAVGNNVQGGEKIAQCGNSGNTTDPHLHFQVQDSEVFAKVDKNYTSHNVATGVKVYFSDIKVNGEKRTQYSPVKGDKVSNY